MNELQKRAWYHKKHQKGLPSPWLTPDKHIKKDAGDVEKGIEHFNEVSAGGDGGDSVSSTAMGECIDDKQKFVNGYPSTDRPIYTGRPSKDIVDKIIVDGIEFPTPKEAEEYIRERDMKDESINKKSRRKRIIEGLKRLDFYCIDNGKRYLDLRGLYESLEEDLSEESKDELSDILDTRAGDDADLVASALNVLNLKDEHPGQDLADIQEDFDAPGVRENTDKLIDMIEDGSVDAKEIAIAFSKWCSEDDVEDFMRTYDLLDESVNKKLNENFGRSGFFYIFKHGIGPGTIPKDVDMLDAIELPNNHTGVWLDRFLTTDELMQYDIPPETRIEEILKRLDITRYDIEDILDESVKDVFKDRHEEEVEDAKTYNKLANKYPKYKDKFKSTAKDEEKHARRWENALDDLDESLLDENKVELARVSDYGLNHFDIYGIVDKLKNAKTKKAQFISLILRSMDFEARMLTDAGRNEHIIKVQRWYNIAMFPSTHNSQTKQDIDNGLRGDFTFQPPKGRVPHDKANDMLKALGLHASALLNKNGDEQIQFETKREKDIDPVTGQDTGRGASKVETHYYSIDSSNQIIREYTPQELIDNGFVKDAFGKKYGSGYNPTTRTFFVAGIIDILEN